MSKCLVTLFTRPVNLYWASLTRNSTVSWTWHKLSIRFLFKGIIPFTYYLVVWSFLHRFLSLLLLRGKSFLLEPSWAYGFKLWELLSYSICNKKSQENWKIYPFTFLTHFYIHQNLRMPPATAYHPSPDGNASTPRLFNY